MPTLTRLLAAILFYLTGLWAGYEYVALFETPPPLAALPHLIAIISGLVGWSYVGRRINDLFLNSVFQCFQGLLVAILLIVSSFSLGQVFLRGYNLRYRSVEDAVQGFFGLVSEHVLRLAVPGYLGMLAGLMVALGGILCLFYRFAEARRTRK